MHGTKRSAACESRIEWWRRVIARRNSSPGTLHQFCHSIGVSERRFYYWSQRIRQADAAAAGRQATTPPSRRPAAPPAPRNAGAGDFVPVSVVSHATHTSELEVELANGCAVRFKGSVDSNLLHAVITAAGQIGGTGRGGR